MDHLDTEVVKGRLASCAKRIQEMSETVAHAYQILEYSSERRRNLLARFVDTEAPISKAEHEARRNPEYLRELEKLAIQDDEARVTVFKFKAEMASLDVGRSLLSFDRESLRQLEG